jgi:hypothetical protein
MRFGLFKRNAGEERLSSCVCAPGNVGLKQAPFEEVTRLTGPYEHENVSLARCRECGGTALYYSADVYDDFWQYWCRIDDAERAELLEPDDPDDPDDPQCARRARTILERKAHLVRGPVRGFEWGPPGVPVVQGPPW